MLGIEIKIWLIVGTIVIGVPIMFFLKYIFLKIISIANIIIKKIEYKRNLIILKKNIIKKIQEKENLEEKEEKIEQGTNIVNKNKLQKILIDASINKEKGDLENYERKLIEGLALDSNNLEFLKKLGDYYFNIGFHKKALPILKKIIEIDYYDHKTIWELGQIYFEKEDLDTAKLLISKAIEIKPDNPKYFVTISEIHYSKEEYLEAIRNMEIAIRLRPTHLNYLLGIATLYDEIGDKNNSKKYYYKVLELNPNNEEARQKIYE